MSSLRVGSVLIHWCALRIHTGVLEQNSCITVEPLSVDKEEPRTHWSVPGHIWGHPKHWATLRWGWRHLPHKDKDRVSFSSIPIILLLRSEAGTPQQVPAPLYLREVHNGASSTSSSSLFLPPLLPPNKYLPGPYPISGTTRSWGWNGGQERHGICLMVLLCFLEIKVTSLLEPSCLFLLPGSVFYPLYELGQIHLWISVSVPVKWGS